MIVPVSRTIIFQTSLFADRFICDMQQAYASDFDLSIRSDKKVVNKFYDHLAAFNTNAPFVSGHGVLVYGAKDKRDYTVNFPIRLASFLQDLGIHSVYLMDFVKGNLKDFPFQDFRKRNKFRRLINVQADNLGYVIQTNNLSEILPLFFFSNKYDAPVIFMITADKGTPISLRLCKDGNLHANFYEADTGKIMKSATDAGLLSGDYDICHKYSIYYL